jgi:cyanophycin synthetase
MSISNNAILQAHPDALKLSMTTQRIFCELYRRNTSPVILDVLSQVIQFIDPHSGSKRSIISSLSDKVSATSVRIADRKTATSAFAKQLGIPIPNEEAYPYAQITEELINQTLDTYKKIVIKPLDAAHGHGVSTEVCTFEKAKSAVSHAQKYSDTIILQEQIEGLDTRIIVIDGTFVSAMHRHPASVIGDGKHSILELIKHENKTNHQRSDNYSTLLSNISIPAAEQYLVDRLHDVPASKELVQVVGPSNVSLGGEITDCYSTVPKDVIADAIKLSEALGLVCAGVDFIVNKADGTYKLLEINPTPALYEHDDPYWGMERGAVKKFVDALLQ